MTIDGEKLTDRLLAHARQCRQMANETSNEEMAAELRKLAVECTRAAREATREVGPDATIH
jgi:hypothetical protein